MEDGRDDQRVTSRDPGSPRSQRRKVGISFSEWGAWWAANKDRPSNLYQLNTLRDAVIAGLSLNIFQNHAARVRMANLAQMVNVLQSLILTDKDRMLLTPTYHVFDLYQGHQGATLLPTQVEAPDYTSSGVKVPSLSVSASRAADGEVTLSVVNLDPVARRENPYRRARRAVQTASARVITADSMDARPDFGKADPLVAEGTQGRRDAKRCRLTGCAREIGGRAETPPAARSQAAVRRKPPNEYR